jgi:pimeloyl-ACP methyl ester carboxylesterase
MTTIVMVHGAFCGGWAFDAFRARFEGLGWTVLTPDLRGHETGGNSKGVIGVSMADYARDIGELCASLPEPPVLLGHSMGGLVAQMAARQAKLKALVLLAPSPPWGVAGMSFEEAMTAVGVHVMAPLTNGAVSADRTLMRQFTLDRLSKAERDPILRRLRPESGLAIRQALNWWLDPFMTTSVGPGPLNLPTLALAGAEDVVHPPATVRQTAQRIGAAFEVIPQMSHWLLSGPGWEQVANTVLTWLDEEAREAA